MSRLSRGKRNSGRFSQQVFYGNGGMQRMRGARYPERPGLPKITRPKFPNGQVFTLFRGVDTALRSKGTRAVRHAARTLSHAGVGGGLKGGTRVIGVSKAKLYEMLSICPVA